MIIKYHIYILFFFAFLQQSCISGKKLNNLSYSLEELRMAIGIVAVEIRTYDRFKRQFESRYFIPSYETSVEKQSIKSSSEKSNNLSNNIEEEFDSMDSNRSESYDSHVNKTEEIRAFARFLIIGDRRPYHVIIQVVEEKLEKGVWRIKNKNNKELAQRLAEELRVTLEKGRVERNLIDSFKPL